MNMNEEARQIFDFINRAGQTKRCDSSRCDYDLFRIKELGVIENNNVILKGAKGETLTVDISDVDIVEKLVYDLVQANERIEELEDALDIYEYENYIIESDIPNMEINMNNGLVYKVKVNDIDYFMSKLKDVSGKARNEFISFEGSTVMINPSNISSIELV